MTALNTLHQPPFDVLTDAERKELAQHSTMVFLPEGENLPSAWRGDTFVIIKGKLRQSKDDELIAGLHTHDWFVFSDDDFSTSEECLLYRINGEGLRTISEKNSTLKNLLFADLSARLSTQATRHDYREGRSLLHKAIGDMGEHIKAPHFVAETTSIQAAAAIMNEQHAKHVLVNGADGRVGVFTQTDICLAVGRGADLSQAIAPLTNFTISTIHHAQELSEALLIMTEQKIHRLPVVDDLGQIIGVLGQSELLSFLTNHSGLISSKIDQASDIDALSSCVQMIGKLIRHQTDTGVKIHAICRTVQTLNAQIFAKLWQLIVPNDVYQNTCLFVMGSEGRGEQIMRTDQDNALIIKDGFVCDELPQYAKTFNDTLADMGYPYCDGGIMLCNERWRKSLQDFKAQISDWLTHPSKDSMIWFATFADAHYVCGDQALLNELMQHTQQTRMANNFLNRFAAATLQFGDTSTFWAKWLGMNDSDIDLKKAGIFPIVHGVRSLALEHHIAHTSTRTRLDTLAQLGVMNAKDAQNLKEALDFFLSKRLAVSLVTADRAARKVNPHTLSALEKDVLKESLLVVKNFKQFITHHFRLDIFGV